MKLVITCSIECMLRWIIDCIKIRVITGIVVRICTCKFRWNGDSITCLVFTWSFNWYVTGKTCLLFTCRLNSHVSWLVTWQLLWSIRCIFGWLPTWDIEWNSSGCPFCFAVCIPGKQVLLIFNLPNRQSHGLFLVR